MSAKITDAQLVAYLDGELSGAAHDRVAAAVERDPQTAARAERLLAAHDAAQGALAGIAEAPVPPRLAAAIADAAGRRSDAWRDRLAALTHRAGWRWGAPAVAALAGALAVLLVDTAPGPVYRLAGDEDGSNIAPDAQAALLDALEGGDAGPLNGPDGAWTLDLLAPDIGPGDCRAFGYAEGGRQAAGLACPAGPGSWSVTTVPAVTADDL